MSRLLLVHSDLQAGGGAESYARAIRTRLQDLGHAVETLDIHGLHPAHHTLPRPLLRPLPRPMRALLALGHLPGLRRRHLLRYALVCRVLPRIAARYDAVILSYGEGPALPCPTLTLRHAPALFSTRPDLLAVLGRKSRVRGPYTRLCRAIAGAVPAADGPRDLTIANSVWTAGLVPGVVAGVVADLVADLVAGLSNHGRPAPAVLYPPVQAPQPPPRPSARDPHLILSLGRIVPGKRLEEAVAILDLLRHHGHPARLAIAGRADTPYSRRLLTRLRHHPGVELAPNATDARLRALLARASYGLHCYRFEHFGIAVAEMILAGLVPVVHDGGGVAELVPDPALRFASPAHAARALSRLMTLPRAEIRGISQGLKRGESLQKALNFGAELDRLLLPFLGALSVDHGDRQAVAPLVLGPAQLSGSLR